VRKISNDLKDFEKGKKEKTSIYCLDTEWPLKLFIVLCMIFFNLSAVRPTLEKSSF
jgi:hypothetical protein